MTPERWQQVRDLLHGAMQLPQGQRPAYLDAHCSGDPALRWEVEQLLAAEEALPASFLEFPALEQLSPQSELSASSSVLAAGTKLAPYVVQSLLGAGGMGEVYRARDTRLDRTVAIKVLPRSLSADPVRRQRFEREARAISALHHPNICTLYDIGSQDGTDYLVMEYLEGEGLAGLLQKGRLPLDRALRHSIEIADALDAAHRRGIVHRDRLTRAYFLLERPRRAPPFGNIVSRTYAPETMFPNGSDPSTPHFVPGTYGTEPPQRDTGCAPLNESSS